MIHKCTWFMLFFPQTDINSSVTKVRIYNNIAT